MGRWSGKSEYDRVSINLSRSKNNARELRMIRRIGKMLGFQAKAGTLRVVFPTFALEVVEVISRVKLKAGLGG
jgi:hypothetical protein